MEKDHFLEFIAGLTPGFTPVIEAEIVQEHYVEIDLSATNRELDGINISSSAAFAEFLNDFLQKGNRKVAFGGYLEVRKLYQRSLLFVAGKGEPNRNIHLGMDLWSPEGTPVLAALEGKVHSFRDNAAFGDYGPTIILEHQIANRIFYTLYGHLSKSSLENLCVGQEVEKGEKIGALGNPTENGDYAAHLHFQIIKDLQGKEGDFPGVASRDELEFYLDNCPDPNLLLKIGRK